MLQCSDTKHRLWPIQELLHVLLADAVEMLQDCPPAENDEWLLAVVEKILANLCDQFQIEEEDGYLREVLEQYPAWHPQVLHLHQEHRLLETQLREIKSRMDQEHQAGDISPECRRQLADWIAWYGQHESRERSLVQEAFVLEVGQGE